LFLRCICSELSPFILVRFQPKPAELPTVDDPEMQRAPDRAALAVVSLNPKSIRNCVDIFVSKTPFSRIHTNARQAHTRARTRTLLHTLTHTHTHTHTHTLSHSLTHALTHALTHTCTHSLTHSHMCPLMCLHLSATRLRSILYLATPEPAHFSSAKSSLTQHLKKR
jgi:hypothetical protein